MTREEPACSPLSLVMAGTREEAEAIQDRLRHRMVLTRAIETDQIRFIAGGDAAYASNRVYAAVTVLTFPGLTPVETSCSSCELPFPYIPGLFAFREGPALIGAFERLTTVPDLIILNGHGFAHPKRFGLASHIGVVLDLPTVGVAGRLLTGTAGTPGPARGSTTPVLDRGETIGMAVRTVAGAKPVYVSAGNKTDLEQAVEVVLAATAGHRLTEPVWRADRGSRQCRGLP